MGINIVPEKEMAAHSSILAWRIPWTEEPGGLLSMGSHRVTQDWSDLAAAAAFYIWENWGWWRTDLPVSHSDKWQNQKSSLDNLTSEHRLWNLCCPYCPGAALLVPRGSGSLCFSGKKDELWSEVSYPPSFPYQKPLDKYLWDCGGRGFSCDSSWSQGPAALILGISESSWHPGVNYLTPKILQVGPGHLLGPFPLSSKTHTGKS